MKKNILLLTLVTFLITSCGLPESDNTRTPKSSSGVSKATVEVRTNDKGLTIEQTQIMERYYRDNLVGSIKHLYIISAYSGQVLIYSTVKGKASWFSTVMSRMSLGPMR